MRVKYAMLAIAAAMVALTATGASAVELHGYFRSGIGGNTSGGSQQCFQIPNTDFKFRLGNECENYGELEFRETLYKDKSGVQFKYYGMLAYASAQRQDYESLVGNGNDIALRQNWVEAKNIPGLGGANLWLGKRYFHRNDVHPIDFYYFDPSGFGVGVDDVDVGVAKLAFSVFETSAKDQSAAGGAFDRNSVWRPEVRAYGIPFPGGGSLEVAFTVGIVSDQATSKASPTRAAVSPWVTVQHVQNILGGVNKLALQYGSGSVASLNGYTSTSASSDARQARIVENLLIEPIPEFSAMFVFVYQHKEKVYENPTPNAGNSSGVNWAGDSSNSWAIGVRPYWNISDYFKLQADFGYQSFTPTATFVDAGPNTGAPYTSNARRELWKVTIAPTVTPAPGTGGAFWTRPELRIFFTYAQWNTGSQAAGIVGQNAACVAAGATSSSAFSCATNGATFGAQVETWW